MQRERRMHDRRRNYASPSDAFNGTRSPTLAGSWINPPGWWIE